MKPSNILKQQKILALKGLALKGKPAIADKEKFDRWSYLWDGLKNQGYETERNSWLTEANQNKNFSNTSIELSWRDSESGLLTTAGYIASDEKNGIAYVKYKDLPMDRKTGCEVIHTPTGARITIVKSVKLAKRVVNCLNHTGINWYGDIFNLPTDTSLQQFVMMVNGTYYGPGPRSY